MGQEKNSGAAAKIIAAHRITIHRGLDKVAFALRLPYRIVQHYLGELQDYVSQDDVEAAARYADGDFALELKGENLHLFRVIVREVS